MKDSRASKRYAAAFLDLASEARKIDDVEADMKLIKDSITISHELSLFFSSPVIDRSKKKNVVKSLYEGKVNQMTMSFLYLLITKGRESLAPGIATEFLELLDEKRGIVNAELRAPFELDPKNKQGAQSKLEALTGKKVRVNFRLDKGLIGGFLAQIGDTVYDGSVRHQLELLRRQLAEQNSFGSSMTEQTK